MRFFCFGFLVFLGLASLGTPTPSTHTVQTGETVYAIAKKYGITTDAILQANPDLNPSRIHAGDKIRLPSAKPLTSPAAPKAPTVSSNPPVPTTAKPKEWVRVEKGDTLSKIARKEGIRLEDLRKWNRIDGHTIRQLYDARTTERTWHEPYNVSLWYTDPTTHRQELDAATALHNPEKPNV